MFKNVFDHCKISTRQLDPLDCWVLTMSVLFVLDRRFSAIMCPFGQNLPQKSDSNIPFLPRIVEVTSEVYFSHSSLLSKAALRDPPHISATLGPCPHGGLRIQVPEANGMPGLPYRGPSSHLLCPLSVHRAGLMAARVALAHNQQLGLRLSLMQSGTIRSWSKYSNPWLQREDVWPRSLKMKWTC